MLSRLSAMADLQPRLDQFMINCILNFLKRSQNVFVFTLFSHGFIVTSMFSKNKLLQTFQKVCPLFDQVRTLKKTWHYAVFKRQQDIVEDTQNSNKSNEKIS